MDSITIIISIIKKIISFQTNLIWISSSLVVFIIIIISLTRIPITLILKNNKKKIKIKILFYNNPVTMFNKKILYPTNSKTTIAVQLLTIVAITI